jgi:hypothetical protein
MYQAFASREQDFSFVVVAQQLTGEMFVLECDRCSSSSLCVKLVKRLEQEAVDWEAVASTWQLERSSLSVASSQEEQNDEMAGVQSTVLLPCPPPRDDDGAVTEELRGTSAQQRYLVWPRKHNVSLCISERQRSVRVQFVLQVPEAHQFDVPPPAVGARKTTVKYDDTVGKVPIPTYGRVGQEADASVPWCRLETDMMQDHHHHHLHHHHAQVLHHPSTSLVLMITEKLLVFFPSHGDCQRHVGFSMKMSRRNSFIS